jgi:hypothetical protein
MEAGVHEVELCIRFFQALEKAGLVEFQTA